MNELDFELRDSYMRYNTIVKVIDDTHLSATFKNNTYIFEFDFKQMFDKAFGITIENEGNIEAEMREHFKGCFNGQDGLDFFVESYLKYRENIIENVSLIFKTFYNYDSIVIDDITEEKIMLETKEDAIRRLIEYAIKEEFSCLFIDYNVWACYPYTP